MNSGLLGFPSNLLLGNGKLKVQGFLTSGVWKKPPNVDAVYIILVGGAGGGGGGGGTGTTYPSNYAGNGGGGGAGNLYSGLIPITSDLTISIGTGGTGGSGGVWNVGTGTAGNAATSGGVTNVTGWNVNLSAAGGIGGGGGNPAYSSVYNTSGYGGANGRFPNFSRNGNSNSTYSPSGVSLITTTLVNGSYSGDFGDISYLNYSMEEPFFQTLVPFKLCVGGNGTAGSGGTAGVAGSITCGGQGGQSGIPGGSNGGAGGNGGSGYVLIAWTE